MNERISDRELHRMARRQWLEEHKHEMIFYTIAAIMITAFAIYLIWAIKNDVPLMFN